MRTLLILLALLLPVGAGFAQDGQDTEESSESSLIYNPDDAQGEIDENSQYTSYPMAAAEAREQAIPLQDQTRSEPTPGRSEYEIRLTYALLAFTALALIVVAVLAARAAKPWSPDSIIRVFGIVLIVPLAVLLVVAGYSEKQIAPVIGLLGVIAGYLLGHSQRPSGGG